MAEVKVIVNRRWSYEDVRITCVKFNLYTCGDNEEYENMLQMVKELEPTPENIYKVAKDIYEHSDKETIIDVMQVVNIMYILEKDVVVTTFELDGEE